MSLFLKYWGAVSIALPFFVRMDNAGDMRFGRNMLFVTATIISAMLFSSVRKLQLQVFSLFLYLAGYSFFFQHSQYSQNVVFQTVYVLIGLLFIVHSAQAFPENSEKHLINILLVISLSQCAFFLLQYAGIDPYETFLSLTKGGNYIKYKIVQGVYLPVTSKEAPALIGSLSQQTLSGVLASCFLPVYFRRKIWPLAILPIVIIIITKSAMVALSGIATVIAWLLLKRYSKKLMLIGLSLGALVLLIISAFLGIKDSGFFSFNGRIEVWKKAITWFDDLPSILFGRGLGYFPDFFSRTFGFDRPIFLEAHNEYLEFYICYGLIGIGVLILLLLPAFHRRSPTVLACFVGLLFNSFGNFPFHLSAIALPGLLCYSFLISQNKYIFKEKENGILSDKKVRAINRRA